MKHYLNVCNVNGGEIAPVDIVTFGSPCQDLSVAGKRGGLKHDELGDGETTRSGLFMEAVRIIKEMREKTDGRSPTYAVWENVPGAFSSQKGEDFRVVLEELAKIKASDSVIPGPPKGKWADAGAIMGDGWSIAWRVLDAQFHGVPQRRRRILLVADFAGGRAGEILFECSGLPGYPAESGAAGQGIAGDATGGTVANDRAEGIICAVNQNANGEARIGTVANTLSTNGNASGRNAPLICAAFSAGQGAKAGGIGWQEECAPTLKGVMSGGNTVPTICLLDDQGGSVLSAAEDATVAPTIRAQMHGNIPAVCLPFDTTQITSPQNGSNPQWGDPCHPLSAQGHPPAVVCVENHPADSRVKIIDDGTCQTLTSRMGTGGGNTPMVLEMCNDGHSDYTAGAVYCALDGRDAVGCLKARYGKGCEQLNETLTGCVIDAIRDVSKDAFHDMLVAGKEPIVLDRAAFNQGENALFDIEVNVGGPVPPIVARGPSAVCHAVPEKIRYIVRRLTPTECARLQGFPDWWSELPTITDMSDEDYSFWCDVLETKAEIEDKPYKPKTRPQMVAWYNKLHNDGAEYKMWGNGVALPVVRVPLHEMAKLGARTLGSLFDGSGGFPLAGVLEGITPLWASEIEPYPIAVTRARFGDTAMRELWERVAV